MEIVKPEKTSKSSPRGELLQNKGALRIRAYCSKCGKLLQESVNMSKKQLILAWDRAVLGAVGIKCQDCNNKFPNFDINLKIYNSRLDIEHSPEKYIKLPKRRDTPEQLFTSIANRWNKEHPDQKVESIEEVQKSLEDSRTELLGDIETLSKEEIIKQEVEKRKKYNEGYQQL